MTFWHFYGRQCVWKDNEQTASLTNYASPKNLREGSPNKHLPRINLICENVRSTFKSDSDVRLHVSPGGSATGKQSRLLLFFDRRCFSFHNSTLVKLSSPGYVLYPIWVAVTKARRKNLLGPHNATRIINTIHSQCIFMKQWHKRSMWGHVEHQPVGVTS